MDEPMRPVKGLMDLVIAHRSLKVQIIHVVRQPAGCADGNTTVSASEDNPKTVVV